MYFRNSLDRLSKIDEMTLVEQPHVTFGIPFLDDALDGLYGDDLAIFSAITGGGKTEISANISYHASKTNKRVFYFALEAHQAEIEARIKFKLLSQAFYTEKNWRDIGYRPDYQKWIHGKQFNFLKKYYAEVDEILSKGFKNLNTYYGDHEFNVGMFEGMLGQIGDKCDLLVLDHVHHISLDDENENMAFKKLVRELKKILSHYRVPIVVVAQLRKSDKYSTKLLPGLDDIYGASEFVKMATKVIVTAPAKEEAMVGDNVLPTFFRILKNRTAGSRTYFTSVSGFDFMRNEYVPRYYLGVMKDNDTKFERIETWQYPEWATRP